MKKCFSVFLTMCLFLTLGMVLTSCGETSANTANDTSASGTTVPGTTSSVTTTATDTEIPSAVTTSEGSVTEGDAATAVTTVVADIQTTEAPTTAAKPPVFQMPADGKPIKVVLLGDSIRQIGYGTMLPGILGSKFTVWQPDDNCRFAEYTLRMLYDYRDSIKDADIIHWNNGLWDMCNLFGDGEFTDIDTYVATMERIAKLLLSYGKLCVNYHIYKRTFGGTEKTTPYNVRISAIRNL